MSDVARRDGGVVKRTVNWILLNGSRWAVAGGALVPIAITPFTMAQQESEDCQD